MEGLRKAERNIGRIETPEGERNEKDIKKGERTTIDRERERER